MESRSAEEIRLQGTPVSPGIAIAEAVVHWQDEMDIPMRSITVADIPDEIARFEAALIATRQELVEIQQRFAEAIGAEDASIFDAHLLVVEDRTLIDEALRGLERDLHNIEFVFHQVAEKYCHTLSKINDPYLQERVVDVEDVTKRVLRHLLGKGSQRINQLDRPHIIVARTLTPSDTALINRRLVKGFLTETGSRTSHAAIMARSLGIPSIVGVPGICSRITTGDPLLVDGYTGNLIIHPSPEAIFEFQRIEDRKVEIASQLDSIRDVASDTMDGHHIVLSANIELADEAAEVALCGAEGVGLFRTEFLYLNRSVPPGEEEQYQAYRHVAETCAPHGVIIRTLDIGGDKLSSLAGHSTHEANPFLGCRAIRLCLEQPELFKTQLRAILRAASHGTVRIMYPMVSGLDELRRANEILRACKDELAREGVEHNPEVEVGTMIEIPSAALIADLLAPEVAFFSIGTNDLIQYTIAVDRVNERIAHLYNPLHPAVLRLLHQVVGAARARGIWVGVCGEMAAEILYTPLLIGLGMDELSVGANTVPRIKKAVRSLRRADCQELAAQVTGGASPEEIPDLCSRFARARYAELFDC